MDVEPAPSGVSSVRCWPRIRAWQNSKTRHRSPVVGAPRGPEAKGVLDDVLVRTSSYSAFFEDEHEVDDEIVIDARLSPYHQTPVRLGKGPEHP